MFNKVSPKVDFVLLAKAFNFKNAYKVLSKKSLKRVLLNLYNVKESAFVHVKVRNDNNNSIGKRVSDKYTCTQIKTRFMNNFNHDKKNLSFK